MYDIEAQDCELEYWNQQAEDYALVQIPCEDLRAIITRAWQAPAFNSAPSASEARAEAAEARVKRLEDLIRVLLENDPDDAVSDGGHTVLDLWRHIARAALKEPGQ